MNEIIFEDLPVATHGGRPSINAELIARVLRDNPGAWARIKSYDKPGAPGALANSIKKGANVAFRPKGAFDAATRKVDGEFRVYARYVGEV